MRVWLAIIAIIIGVYLLMRFAPLGKYLPQEKITEVEITHPLAVCPDCTSPSLEKQPKPLMNPPVPSDHSVEAPDKHHWPKPEEEYHEIQPGPPEAPRFNML